MEPRSALQPLANSALNDLSPTEVRCSVRFPLALPVVITTLTEEYPAVTINVSASGVCFRTDRALPSGESIRFSLRMPGEILATNRDVLVLCHGRVVRSSPTQAEFCTAATIDEYSFQDQ